MEYENVWNIYFSPSGTTKKVVERISAKINKQINTIDLLKEQKEYNFGGNDVAIIGMPVFSGRLPAPCVELLRKLKGTKTTAIAVVTYGNRAYDDAMLELTNILKEQNFFVAAAAAVVTQHSIFPTVGSGRPDSADMAKLDDFGLKCFELLQDAGKVRLGSVEVKGSYPYRQASPIPLKPSVSAACNRCGLCADICPTHAISHDSPQKTDKHRCITCTACIAACPTHARKLKGMIYQVASKKFNSKCVNRLELEIFI